MFCPNCGKENKDDFKFCIHCGYNLQGLQTASTPTPAPVYTKEELEASLDLSLSPIAIHSGHFAEHLDGTNIKLLDVYKATDSLGISNGIITNRKKWLYPMTRFTDFQFRFTSYAPHRYRNQGFLTRVIKDLGDGTKACGLYDLINQKELIPCQYDANFTEINVEKRYLYGGNVHTNKGELVSLDNDFLYNLTEDWYITGVCPGRVISLSNEKLNQGRLYDLDSQQELLVKDGVVFSDFLDHYGTCVEYMVDGWFGSGIKSGVMNQKGHIVVPAKSNHGTAYMLGSKIYMDLIDNDKYDVYDADRYKKKLKTITEEEFHEEFYDDNRTDEIEIEILPYFE